MICLVASSGSQLTSWVGEKNPGPGMYTLNFQLDCNLVLYASNQVNYWASDTQGQTIASKPPFAVLDNFGNFTIFDIYSSFGLYNKTLNATTRSTSTSVFMRLTLDYDGNLRIFSAIDSGFSQWVVVWTAVINANCIPGVLLDTFGCNQTTGAPNTSSSHSSDSLEINSRNGLLIVIGSISAFTFASICFSFIAWWCLRNREGGVLAAGEKFSESSQVMCEGKQSTDSLDSGSFDCSTGVIKVEIVNSVLNREQDGGKLQRFSFMEMQEATRNFRKKLGSGAFGEVYKGKLADERLVAVKRLGRSQQSDQQFQTEVQTIGSIFHPNLVRLYGYCSEDNYQMLVYEYVANKSLEKFIFQQDPSDARHRILDWPTRLSIALGTARGLQECHELQGGRPRVIHCDVKPENILLDSKFGVKVSDFGLAKIMGIDKSWTRTHLRGTRGYLAPEWLTGRIVSVKVDVYSFGVVLVELITGSRCCDKSRSDFDFLMWVFNEACLEMVSNVVDKRMKSYDEKQVLLALRCALWCVQEKEHMRPSMRMVVEMLEGKLPVSPPPPPKDLPKTSSAPANFSHNNLATLGDGAMRER